MSPSSRHLREQPPRHIDFFTKLTVLFGGAVQQMGWFFFAIGSLFAWVFVGNSEAKFFLEKETHWLKAPGMVLSVDGANATENGEQIYRVMATFEVDGETFIAKGYSKGRNFPEGEKVVVAYEATDPGRAHISGLRCAKFDVWVAFVLIFPLLGLCFVAFGIFKNLRSIRMLVHGTFTRGKLVSKEATGTAINNRRVFKYEFAFEVGGREERAICQTHETEKVEDEEKEIILYDRFDPSIHVVYGAAPMPFISENGRIESARTGRAVLLLMPAFALFFNWWMWARGMAIFWG